MRELAHDLQVDGGEIGHHAEEQVLGDLERGQVLGRDHGRGARHVAQDGGLADDLVAAEPGHPERSAARLQGDVGRAVDDHVGGIAGIALMKQGMTGLETQSF